MKESQSSHKTLSQIVSHQTKSNFGNKISRNFKIITLIIIISMLINVCFGQSIGTSAGFPAFLSNQQIQYFGFLPVGFGIFYCFYGISLVTRNYINPSIDVIKSRNRFSSNTMNATLLAMTNSAAE